MGSKNKFAIRPLAARLHPGQTLEDFELRLEQYHIGDIIDWWIPGIPDPHRSLIVDTGYLLWPHNKYIVVMSLKGHKKTKIWEANNLNHLQIIKIDLVSR